MNKNPANLKELEEHFGTKEQCLSYLSELLRNSFCCKKCQNDQAWITKDFKYECTNCKYQVTVTAGTVFYRSHIPLNSWFKAMWYMISNEKEVNAHWLQGELGLGSYHSALRLFNTIQQAMIYSKHKDKCEKLKGTVEVYWKCIKTPKGKIPIVVAVELNKAKIKWIYMSLLKNCSFEDIYGFIKNNIEMHSELKCKEWNELYKECYTQGIIYEWSCATKVFEDLENFFLHIKQFEFDEKHITHYLQKYCVTNGKYKIKCTFQEIIQAVVDFPSLSYEKIKALKRQ